MMVLFALIDSFQELLLPLILRYNMFSSNFTMNIGIEFCFKLAHVSVLRVTLSIFDSVAQMLL